MWLSLSTGLMGQMIVHDCMCCDEILLPTVAAAAARHSSPHNVLCKPISRHHHHHHHLFPACRACDYVYIDYVRRSRSSSCRLLRPINCQTYITLHHHHHHHQSPIPLSLSFTKLFYNGSRFVLLSIMKQNVEIDHLRQRGTSGHLQIVVHCM